MEITLKNRKFKLVACGLCLIAFGIGLMACKQEVRADVPSLYVSQLYKGVNRVVWNINPQSGSLDLKSLPITRDEIDQITAEVLNGIFLEKFGIKVVSLTDPSLEGAVQDGSISLSINLYLKDGASFLEPAKHNIVVVMGSFRRFLSDEKKEITLPYTFNYQPGLVFVYKDRQKFINEYRSALKVHLDVLSRNLICQNNSELDECRKEPIHLKILEVMKNSPAYPDLKKEYQFQLEEWQKSKGGVPHE